VQNAKLQRRRVSRSAWSRGDHPRAIARDLHQVVSTSGSGSGVPRLHQHLIDVRVFNVMSRSSSRKVVEVWCLRRAEAQHANTSSCVTDRRRIGGARSGYAGKLASLLLRSLSSRRAEARYACLARTIECPIDLVVRTAIGPYGRRRGVRRHVSEPRRELKISARSATKPSAIRVFDARQTCRRAARHRGSDQADVGVPREGAVDWTMRRA